MELNDLNLLQMPEVVMGHILDKLDIPDVLTLRKTCHHLRNLIAELHPDPKIVSTSIKVDPDYIEFKMNFDKGEILYPKGALLRIKYGLLENASDVCAVQWFRSDGIREFYFEGDDFISHFCRDFELIFGGHSIFEFFRQPRNLSTIQDFTLNLKYFPENHDHWEAVTFRLLDSMESTLICRPRLLPVKEFITVTYDKSHVLQILPCFQPKTLEKISITYTAEWGCWFLNGLFELEQWRMAKVLRVFDVQLSAEIQKFFDFEEINIKLGKVEVKEVVALMKAIRHSISNLTTGRIEFAVCNAEQQFLRAYDFPFADIDENGDERQSWFFKIANKDSILQISFYPNHLRFSVLESPPKNARVIK